MIYLVSQKVLLLFGVVLGGSVQPLSEYLDSSSVSVILSCLFFLLLIQEVWVIQWNMREENVEFTRRFNRRFPRGNFLL